MTETALSGAKCPTHAVLTKAHKDMETAQKFLTAISNIQWSEFDRISTSSGTLKSDDGFFLSYNTKFNEDNDLPHIQIIAQVRYNDAYVMTWGFSDDASQIEFIKILGKTKQRIADVKDRQDNWNGKIGRELFK
jgi:hypothetical protein